MRRCAGAPIGANNLSACAAISPARRSPTIRSSVIAPANLRCKAGKYLSCAASAQAHFWAPFCDAVGLPEMRDTRPGGDEDLIRKVKEHMLTKTRDEWLELIPKEIAVVPMLEFDEVLEGPFAKERGMVLELDHPLEGTVRQLSSLSACPTRRRLFATSRPC